jgi:TolB protein
MLLYRPKLQSIILVLWALVMLPACGLLNDPGFIAYTVGEEGGRNIGVVRVDGSQPRIVVANAADDFSPVWSPDHKRLAFLTTRDGNVEVYVAPSDGSTVMRATDTAVSESQPVWSPDSRQLAYVSPDDKGNSHIFVIELSALVPQRLTLGTPAEEDPAWSPDGKWIAYTALDGEGKPLGIFLRNPSGVNRMQLTEGFDYSPVWSSDSKHLAFVSERDGNQEIYAIKLGTGENFNSPVRVTENVGRDFAPSWEPGGDRIAFLSDLQGNISIYSAAPSGENLEALTTNEVDEWAFAWGPTSKIAFVSTLVGNPSLFVMEGDGSNQQQVIFSDRAFTLLDW